MIRGKLTQNFQCDRSVYLRFCINLTLVNAGVPRLHVIYSQIPVVVLRIADYRKSCVAGVSHRHGR